MSTPITTDATYEATPDFVRNIDSGRMYQGVRFVRFRPDAKRSMLREQV